VHQKPHSGDGSYDDWPVLWEAKTMKQAMLYERLPDRRVRCDLCADNCVIDEGKLGICRVRENREGELFTHVYGQLIARHVDPIEKKPLFHFFPGSRAYSVATPGCNFRCRWCQNSEIALSPRQHRIEAGRETHPEEIVADAQAANCRNIAYTPSNKPSPRK
jgi:pyruvate formate lyase activating enzyme